MRSKRFRGPAPAPTGIIDDVSQFLLGLGREGHSTFSEICYSMVTNKILIIFLPSKREKNLNYYKRLSYSFIWKIQMS